jgi:hypothetical protein
MTSKFITRENCETVAPAVLVMQARAMAAVQGALFEDDPYAWICAAMVHEWAQCRAEAKLA